MNTTSLRHILSFLLILLLAGCGTPADRQVRQTLRCAEEVLAEHPDSALTLLTPLDTVSLTGEEQAWYAVLRTQAVYKLWRPVTDSLPLLATAYYGTPRRPHYRAAMAWYSLGCVYTDHNDDPRAIDAYLKARDLFPDTLCRYYALTEQNLGMHYLNRLMFAEAKGILTSCRAHLIELSDSTRIPFADFYLSYANLVLGDYEAAEKGYESVLHNKLSSQYCQTTSIFQLAKVAYATADYTKALFLLDQYLVIANPITYGTAYSIKGDVFYRENQLDSALYYYRKSFAYPGDVYTEEDNRKKILEISLLLLGDSLHTLFKQQQELQDSIYFIQKNSEINDILERYTAELMHTQVRNRYMLFSLSSFSVAVFCILGCIILFSRRDRRRKTQFIKLQNELRQLNTETLENITIVWEELDEAAKAQFVAQLKKKMEICRELFYGTKEGSGLLKLSTNTDALSKEKVESFICAIENSFVDVLKDLRVRLPMVKNSDWLFCMSEYLKCPREITAFHLNVKTDSLRMRKMRIESSLPEQIYRIFFK